MNAWLGRLVLAAWIACSPAAAHNEWAWIEKHTNKQGLGCCGEKDCFPVEPADLEYRADGILIRSLDELVPWDEIQKSEDHQYWRCEFGGTRRCFFAPVSS